MKKRKRSKEIEEEKRDSINEEKHIIEENVIPEEAKTELQTENVKETEQKDEEMLTKLELKEDIDVKENAVRNAEDEQMNVQETLNNNDEIKEENTEGCKEHKMKFNKIWRKHNTLICDEWMVQKHKTCKLWLHDLHKAAEEIVLKFCSVVENFGDSMKESIYRSKLDAQFSNIKNKIQDAYNIIHEQLKNSEQQVIKELEEIKNNICDNNRINMKTNHFQEALLQAIQIHSELDSLFKEEKFDKIYEVKDVVKKYYSAVNVINEDIQDSIIWHFIPIKDSISSILNMKPKIVSMNNQLISRLQKIKYIGFPFSYFYKPFELFFKNSKHEFLELNKNLSLLDAGVFLSDKWDSMTETEKEKFAIVAYEINNQIFDQNKNINEALNYEQKGKINSEKTRGPNKNNVKQNLEHIDKDDLEENSTLIKEKKRERKGRKKGSLLKENIEKNECFIYCNTNKETTNLDNSIKENPSVNQNINETEPILNMHKEILNTISKDNDIILTKTDEIDKTELNKNLGIDINEEGNSVFNVTSWDNKRMKINEEIDIDIDTAEEDNKFLWENNNLISLNEYESTEILKKSRWSLENNKNLIINDDLKNQDENIDPFKFRKFTQPKGGRRFLKMKNKESSKNQEQNSINQLNENENIIKETWDSTL